ncbi:helix-turn-helix domain-containing protein [Actinoplanes sp. NPDC051861]|uniref:helix-turn-helix domain-containing protein n=1 Tax=Actinoplanes sp. NPDC051861 TaxID=3155170 RepID=UPI0034171A3D
MPLGERLRGFRHTAGLTMEQLSDSSGVSVRAISDMERGHIRAPQPRTLAALSTALGLTDDERERLEEDARALRLHTAGARPRSFEPPRAVTDFVGRDAEFRRVTTGCDPIVVVHGQPGVGKTAFALRLAEALRDRFPDGCLYLDLRGLDPEPPSAGEVATHLLKAFDVHPRRIGDTGEQRCGQLRALLRDRRCLLVLDNAADETQVRPLLPGGGAGRTVVTSRRALAGLESVLRVPLKPLEPAESAELLSSIAGRDDDMTAVARLCGHLPLALRIAGTRLANRPAWTAGHLASLLADEDRRLATLHIGDTGVAAAYALSHAQLSGEGRALFRRLAHLPDDDFGAPIAAELIAADPHDAGDRLDELVELGLLEHSGADRYRLAGLLRIYAAERLRAEEPAAKRAATRLRIEKFCRSSCLVPVPAR